MLGWSFSIICESIRVCPLTAVIVAEYMSGSSPLMKPSNVSFAHVYAPVPLGMSWNCVGLACVGCWAMFGMFGVDGYQTLTFASRI